MEGASLLKGFGTVGCFAANFEGIMLEERTYGFPYGDFVFNDEDAFEHGTQGEHSTEGYGGK